MFGVYLAFEKGPDEHVTLIATTDCLVRTRGVPPPGAQSRTSLARACVLLCHHMQPGGRQAWASPGAWPCLLPPAGSPPPSLASRPTTCAGIFHTPSLHPCPVHLVCVLSSWPAMPSGTAPVLPYGQVYTWEIEDLDYLATKCSPAMAGFWRSFALCQASNATSTAGGHRSGLQAAGWFGAWVAPQAVWPHRLMWWHLLPPPTSFRWGWSGMRWQTSTRHLWTGVASQMRTACVMVSGAFKVVAMHGSSEGNSPVATCAYAPAQPAACPQTDPAAPHPAPPCPAPPLVLSQAPPAAVTSQTLWSRGSSRGAACAPCCPGCPHSWRPSCPPACGTAPSRTRAPWHGGSAGRLGKGRPVGHVPAHGGTCCGAYSGWAAARCSFRRICALQALGSSPLCAPPVPAVAATG